MLLKLTLQRSGMASRDVSVSCDSTATVGDIAAFLEASAPGSKAAASGNLTLSVLNRSNLLLDHQLPVAQTALQSGDTVSLMPASDRYVPGGRGGHAAEMVVTAGLDKGAVFPLAKGSNVIGRDGLCDVALRDQLVSRRHARINITDHVEILDLGSANGTLVQGTALARAILRPDDDVEIGDTQFRVRLTENAGVAPALAGEGEAAEVRFIRSPYLCPVFEGGEVETPQPPERNRAQRFPWIPMVAPIVMGAIMYAVTRNLLSILFVALSPIMMVGAFWESRRSTKRDFREAVAAYDEELAKTRGHLDALQERERSSRLREHVAGAELLQAAETRSELLWCRRNDADRFGQVRLGLGTAKSRTKIKVGGHGRAPREQVQKAEELAEQYAQITQVPIVGDFTEHAIGVAGPRSLAIPVARNLLLQTIVLHSPAELTLCGFFSSASAAEWDWLKWVPHTSSAHSPLKSRSLASGAAAAVALMDELESIVSERAGHSPTWESPAVVVLVESEPSIDHSRLVQLAENGPTKGVYLLWIASSRPRLPAACKTFVALESDPRLGAVGTVTTGSLTVPVEMEDVSSQRVAVVARSLAGVVDAGAPQVDASDIPRTISLLSAIDDDDVDQPRGIIDRWMESGSIHSGPYAAESAGRGELHLRAILGQSASGKHIIDLRSDGPHALIGGTTGSGKSELLRAWILALATSHSPQRVNFLFVDYKGGSAFEEFKDLPHSLGVVSNLSAHLVDRALTSLKAELTYRMNLFLDNHAKDLDEMYEKAPQLCPPSLVIVVDEFAALVKEIPEFVDGMVDVGQRGRSLGMHLILATQQPKGVIGDNLRANTNLRIALRMADADDSNDVLGSPDASLFTSEQRGRAISKSGPTRLVQFQSAYSGGITEPGSDAPEIAVEELSITQPVAWSPPAAPKLQDMRETDIERLVAAIATAKIQAQLPNARQAWKPELSANINMLKPGSPIPYSDRDSRLYFALGDDPANQSQPPLYYEPDAGNLVVLGASGSGKTNLLRVLAASAALASANTPVHIYALDFAGMALAGIAALPNVGDVIDGKDNERVIRVLKTLRSTIDERARRYQAVGADSLDAYRARSGNAQEPRILLFIDGIGGFRSTYEAQGQQWIDLLMSILSDGRARGVHVVLTADQRGALTSAMSSAIQRKLAMRMASVDDYSLLNVAMGILSSESPPGRGVEGHSEFQVATVAESPDLASQDAELASLGSALRSEVGVSEAPRVERLPARILGSDVPTDAALLSLGIESESLAPYLVSPVGPLMVTGLSGSGRTNCMRWLTREAKRVMPTARFHLLAERRSELHSLAWDSVCADPEAVTSWADQLTADLEADPGRKHVLFVDSVDTFFMSSADFPLESLCKRLVEEDHFIAAEGDPVTVSRDSGFIRYLRSSRRGIVLQPEQENGGSIFGVRFPVINPDDYPIGRGIYVERRKIHIIQLPIADS